METNKTFMEVSEKERALSERIGKIVLPIFYKVLKETDNNGVRVGTDGADEYDFSIIKPHNYRRWFDFNKKTFNPPTRLSDIKRRGISYKNINYGSEHFFKDYMGCNIKVKKYTIEIQNKIENNRAYAIDNYNSAKQIKQIVEEKEIQNIKVLKAFVKEFGGVTQFKLLKHTEEVKIEHNSITEKIEKRLTWHTDEHKKVYDKKLVELYNINDAIKLIDNSIFYKNVEEIALPLRAILSELKKPDISTPRRKNYLTPEDNLDSSFFVSDNAIVKAEGTLSVDELAKVITSVETGQSYKSDIERLSNEEQIQLSRLLLKKRIFGDPISDMRKRIFGGG